MSETWRADMKDVAAVIAEPYWRIRKQADDLFAREGHSVENLRCCSMVDALAQVAGVMGLVLEDYRPTREEADAASLRIRSAPGV